MLTDLFVGNLATERDSWHKSGVTEDNKINDLSECLTLSDQKYKGKNFYEARNNFDQQCLLDKGYKFYPRGLDGTKASRCRLGYGDGPACKPRK